MKDKSAHPPKLKSLGALGEDSPGSGAGRLPGEGTSARTEPPGNR